MKTLIAILVILALLLIVALFVYATWVDVTATPLPVELTATYGAEQFRLQLTARAAVTPTP